VERSDTHQCRHIIHQLTGSPQSISTSALPAQSGGNMPVGHADREKICGSGDIGAAAIGH